MGSTALRDRVTVQVDGGIADVRLARPDKRNALDGPMFAAIAEAGALVKSAPGVRVVVLSGEGASFCAGLDFSAFAAMAGGGGLGGGGLGGGDTNPVAMTAGGVTHLGQQTAWVWQEVAVPVIAAVHGHALGGGLQIALGADIRVVHPATKLSVRELHWGLTPDMTATLFLSRLVRPDVAKELTFTARIFDGAEAARIGLVTHLDEQPYERALALAREIAGRNPDAVRGAKALINALANKDAAAQFERERVTITGLLGSPNQIEAVTAELEQRPAVFTDPA